MFLFSGLRVSWRRRRPHMTSPPGGLRVTCAMEDPGRCRHHSSVTLSHTFRPPTPRACDL